MLVIRARFHFNYIHQVQKSNIWFGGQLIFLCLLVGSHSFFLFYIQYAVTHFTAM